MKTGRVRSKQEMPAEAPQPAPEGEEPQAAPSAAVQAAPLPSAPSAGKNRTVPLVAIAAVALIACVALFLLLRRCGGAEEWVKASQVTGRWTAGLQLFVPDVQTSETWQSSCTGSQGLVEQATCVQRPTGKFQSQPTRTYDEYAFNSYYDTTYQKTYDAQGTDFVVSALGGGERIENDQRLVAKEYLRNDTCQQTAYTLWVDDPQDSTQEVEVYLYDCEVWQTVTVYDPEKAPWCQCRLTVLAPQPVQTLMGTGPDVTWPSMPVPAGGKADQSLEASVTFAAGDGQYSYTQTTSDLAQYRDWLTTPYYLGIRDGKAVKLSKEPQK